MNGSSLRLKERLGWSAPAGFEAERGEVEESGSVRTRVVAPDPEVSAASGRRRFSAAYKARIVREADACTGPGEIGALLRREGLYSSSLANWRKEYRKAGESALRDDKRGRKVMRNPLAGEVERLGRELERTQKKLTQAEMIIEFQKNLCEILGISPTRVSEDGEK
jgi:transposase-like protein